MQFTLPTGSLELRIKPAIVAGWTGRDDGAVTHHIEELAALGVAPPSQVPLFDRVASSLLTQGHSIEVVGGETSGEVEPLLVKADDRMWLGLASDHTDRATRRTRIIRSYQNASPIAVSSNHLDNPSP